MRIFIIGDYYSDTGPARVTQKLIQGLKNGNMYQKYRNKLLRLAELWVKIPFSDICVISGYSRQNLWTLKIARIFKKKCVYLMHGCVEHENMINHTVDEEMTRCERATLAGCDLILAVSEGFENFLKERYPQHKEKISHLTNGIDWKELAVERGVNEAAAKSKGDGSRENPYVLISVGGGMPRKLIRVICRALCLLMEKGIYTHLIVAGDKGEDTEEIRSYDFVEDISLVRKEKLYECYRKSALCVQNSSFETFALAPLEALVNGCSLLLSKHIGALETFDNQSVYSTDIINNVNDEKEIAAKIEFLLNNPNNERLLGAIDREDTSWESVCVRLQNILKKIKG